MPTATDLGMLEETDDDLDGEEQGERLSALGPAAALEAALAKAASAPKGGD